MRKLYNIFNLSITFIALYATLPQSHAEGILTTIHSAYERYFNEAQKSGFTPEGSKAASQQATQGVNEKVSQELNREFHQAQQNAIREAASRPASATKSSPSQAEKKPEKKVDTGLQRAQQAVDKNRENIDTGDMTRDSEAGAQHITFDSKNQNAPQKQKYKFKDVLRPQQ